jgi:hypothetical protein
MLGFLRFIAGVFLLIAVIFAVNDATKGLAGRGSGAITVHQTWSAVSSPTLKAAQNAVERYTHPAIWQWGVLNLLQLPAWAMFGTLGLALAYAGRRRRRVNIYAN